MPISKTFTISATGAIAQHHVVKRIESYAPFSAVDLDVQSFISAAAHAAGLAPIWSTPVRIELTGGAMPSLAALEHWLITDARSPIAGGAIV